MESLLLGNAKEKVAATLFILTKRFGEKNGGESIVIKLPVTHQAIASLAGLSRETTSLEMKKLEREGVIARQNRHVIVHKLGRLRPKSLSYPRRRYPPHSF
jgi:CRP/FNR family transcriptional regulator